MAAFNHQIECDRIDFVAADDSILFSVFLRIPLLVLRLVLDSILVREKNNRAAAAAAVPTSAVGQRLVGLIVDVATFLAHETVVRTAQRQDEREQTKKAWRPSLQTIEEEVDDDDDEDEYRRVEERRDATSVVVRSCSSYFDNGLATLQRCGLVLMKSRLRSESFSIRVRNAFDWYRHERVAEIPLL